MGENEYAKTKYWIHFGRLATGQTVLICSHRSELTLKMFVNSQLMKVKLRPTNYTVLVISLTDNNLCQIFDRFLSATALKVICNLIINYIINRTILK